MRSKLRPLKAGLAIIVKCYGCRLSARISASLTSFFPPQPATPFSTSGRTLTYQPQVRLSSSSAPKVSAQEVYSSSSDRSSFPRLLSFSAFFAAAESFFVPPPSDAPGGVSNDFSRYARADCGV